MFSWRGGIGGQKNRRQKRRRKWKQSKETAIVFQQPRICKLDSDPRARIRAAGSRRSSEGPFFSFPFTPDIPWLILLEILVAVSLNLECSLSSLKCSSENYSSAWRFHKAANAVRSKRIQLQSDRSVPRGGQLRWTQHSGQVLLPGKEPGSRWEPLIRRVESQVP